VGEEVVRRVEAVAPVLVAADIAALWVVVVPASHWKILCAAGSANALASGRGWGWRRGRGCGDTIARWHVAIGPTVGEEVVGGVEAVATLAVAADVPPLGVTVEVAPHREGGSRATATHALTSGWWGGR
jgi:hypothetical protein